MMAVATPASRTVRREQVEPAAPVIKAEPVGRRLVVRVMLGGILVVKKLPPEDGGRTELARRRLAGTIQHRYFYRSSMN